MAAALGEITTYKGSLAKLAKNHLRLFLNIKVHFVSFSSAIKCHGSRVNRVKCEPKDLRVACVISFPKENKTKHTSILIFMLQRQIYP